MNFKKYILTFLGVFSLLPSICFADKPNFQKIWEFELDYKDYRNTVQSQPKEFEGLLLFVDGIGHLIALDKKSGTLVYRIKLGKGVGRRGFTIDETIGQIAITAGSTLFILDAKSGSILNQTKTNFSVAAPIFTSECVVVFGAGDGTVQCHSRNLKEIFWQTKLGNTARVWSNVLWSKKHKKLYLVTSNAGGLVAENRGPDTYSSSLVAINAKLGSIEFSRQMIKDDVWDFDGVGKPIYVEGFVNNDGKEYDLILGLNKTGTIFAVNAEDGSAIKYGQFEEKIFSKGNGVNANVSQGQIIPSWPSRTNEISLTLNDLRLDQMKSKALRHARFDEFLPPSLDYDVVTKGLHGGPEWHGGVHYKSNNQNLLAIPINNTSWILRLQYLEDDFWLTDFFVGTLKIAGKIKNAAEKVKIYTKKAFLHTKNTILGREDRNPLVVDTTQIHGRWIQDNWSDSSISMQRKDEIYKYTNMKAYNKKYDQYCSACHRNDRNGRYQSELTGDGFVPSLVGYTLTDKFKYGKNYNNFTSLHGPEIEVTKEDLHGIFQFFDTYDKEQLRDEKLRVEGIWQVLLGKDSLPLNKSPWGGVAIIDLKSGEKINEIVIGKMKNADGKWVNSSVIFGGLGPVNSAGETLVVGTVDPKAYYISIPDAKVLHSFDLKRPGSVQPYLTEINGCEAWVIVETGGRFSFYDRALNGYTVEMFINRSTCEN